MRPCANSLAQVFGITKREREREGEIAISVMTWFDGYIGPFATVYYPQSPAKSKLKIKETVL